jgi:hypothetical protein
MRVVDVGGRMVEIHVRQSATATASLSRSAARARHTPAPPRREIDEAIGGYLPYSNDSWRAHQSRSWPS